MTINNRYEPKAHTSDSSKKVFFFTSNLHDVSEIPNMLISDSQSNAGLREELKLYEFPSGIIKVILIDFSLSSFWH